MQLGPQPQNPSTLAWAANKFLELTRSALHWVRSVEPPITNWCIEKIQWGLNKTGEIGQSLKNFLVTWSPGFAQAASHFLTNNLQRFHTWLAGHDRYEFLATLKHATLGTVLAMTVGLYFGIATMGFGSFIFISAACISQARRYYKTKALAEYIAKTPEAREQLIDDELVAFDDGRNAAFSNYVKAATFLPWREAFAQPKAYYAGLAVAELAQDPQRAERAHAELINSLSAKLVTRRAVR